jgi:hypothetical protein
MRLTLSPFRLAVLAAASAAAALGVVGAGCGGDDTIGGGGGPDASTTDHSAGQDVVATDSPLGHDVIAVDAPHDSGSPVDATPDAPAPADFLGATTVAYCHRLRDCCLPDGGGWNEAQCEIDIGPINAEAGTGQNGFAFIATYSASWGGAHVAYDPASAAACIADIANIPCGAFTAFPPPSPAYNPIKDECFGAFRGVLPNDGGPGPNDSGSTCLTHQECLPGGFCDPTVNNGTCVPLLGAGGSCAIAANTGRSEPCTYLGLGTPANYCGPSVTDGGVPTCQAALPDDAGCVSDEWCQSQLCLPNGCGTVYFFSDPGVPLEAGGYCANYTQ